MLAYVAGSVSTDQMFEREWHVHVSHRQFAIQQLLRQ